MTCSTLSKHLNKSSSTATACHPCNTQDSFVSDSHQTVLSEPRPASPQKKLRALLICHPRMDSRRILHQTLNNVAPPVGFGSNLRMLSLHCRGCSDNFFHCRANVCERHDRGIRQVLPCPRFQFVTAKVRPTAVNCGKVAIDFFTSVAHGLGGGSKFRPSTRSNIGSSLRMRCHLPNSSSTST